MAMAEEARRRSWLDRPQQHGRLLEVLVVVIFKAHQHNPQARKLGQTCRIKMIATAVLWKETALELIICVTVITNQNHAVRVTLSLIYTAGALMKSEKQEMVHDDDELNRSTKLEW